MILNKMNAICTIMCISWNDGGVKWDPVCCIIVGPHGEGVCHCVLTCLGLCRTSCVVAVARMALLLPGLSCRLMDSPLTSCTPNSAMVTFSSTTVMVFSARIESDNGDSTYGTEKRKKNRRMKH